MIGVIVALKSEMTELTNFVSNVKPYSVSGYKCYIFKLLNKQVVLIYSGVGKANAAVAAHVLITHFNVSLIINAGFCGSLNSKNGIGQFVIPRFVCYHDVDATAFNYEINQIPYEEKHYEVKNKLINNLTKWIESFGYIASIGTLASGDSFVNSKNYARFHIKEDADIVDMESCAIAQVCSHLDVDFCFIKLISDYVDSEKSSAKQWEEAIKDLTVKLTEVIINVCYQIIYLQH